MKERNSNSFATIIAQAIEEMKAEQGESFCLECINLAELERRSGVSRGKLRRLKKNKFHNLPRSINGSKHRTTKLSGYTGIIDSLLRQGIKNSSVVLERLQQVGFDGGATIVKEYIAAHKHLIPAKRQQVAPQGNRGRRYTTGPGEAYQMDWGFTDVLDYNGKVYRVACFAMICHHCGQRYIEFFPNARQENLFIGMVHAFQYMGIPGFILTDNMKSVVLHRSMDGQPMWQKDYEAFMRTIGFETKLCKPRHPFTKGTVNGTLPTGVIVTKTGDSATDKGQYTATATFALAEGYADTNYEIVGTNPLTKNWSIAQAALVGTKNPGKTLRYTTTAEQTLTAKDFGITAAGTFTANGAVTDAGNVLNAAPAFGKDVKYQLKSGLSFASQTVMIPVTFTPRDTNYAPVNLTVTITLTDRNTVTMNLTASKTSGVVYGDSVTYTATLNKDHAFLNALDKLDGKIKFYLDGTAESDLVSTQSVSGGSTASVTLNFDKLTKGVYAVYGGNAAFANTSANATTSVVAKILTWDVSGLSALKKADGNTSATINGTLRVSGALEGTNPGFTYTNLAGTYASAEVGDHTVTVTVTRAAVTNANYALPTGSPTFTGTINAVDPLPAPPESTPDKQYKLEKEEGISEVPACFANNPDLNTPAKIETQMKLSITKANGNISEANIAIYDITLKFSTDGGKTCQVADESNFPAEGITVILPYPAGTSQNGFDFVITHMFTTGAKAGTTETITPEKTADGLKFVLHSLSPVAVGYQAVTPSGSGDTPAAGNTNLQTGDNSHMILYASLILLSVSGLAIIVTKKRRQRE